jgi:hypothetical protein
VECWHAFSLSKNENITIINDDIMVSWDFVEIFEEYLKSNSAQIYCPANAGFPPTRKIRQGYEWYSKRAISYTMLDRQQYALPPSIAGWCMAIPLSTIEKNWNFDGDLYFGDKDYEARILKVEEERVLLRGFMFLLVPQLLKILTNKHEEIYSHDEREYKTKWKLK